MEIQMKVIASILSQLIIFIPIIAGDFNHQSSLELFPEIQDLYSDFKIMDAQDADFYQTTNKLLSCINQVSKNIELSFAREINNQLGKNRTSMREAESLLTQHYEKLIRPIFAELSSPESIIKIIDGILANDDWKKNTSQRTTGHNLGFVRIPLVSIGGKELPLSKGDRDKSNSEYLKIEVETELRVHVFLGKAEDPFPIGESIHTHSVQMYSRLLYNSLALDQQFFASHAINKDDLKVYEYFDLEIPKFQSQSDYKNKIRANADIDLEYLSDNKIDKYQPIVTYKHYHDSLLLKNRHRENGYKIFKYSPPGMELTFHPFPPELHLEGSVRFHPSVRPHFFVEGPNGKSITICLMTRSKDYLKPDKNRSVPSFFMTKKSENKIHKLGPEGTALKAPPIVATPDELHNILLDLKKEIIKRIDFQKRLLATEDNQITLKNKIYILLTNLFCNIKNLQQNKTKNITIRNLDDFTENFNYCLWQEQSMKRQSSLEFIMDSKNSYATKNGTSLVLNKEIINALKAEFKALTGKDLTQNEMQDLWDVYKQIEVL
jgi:hypothetical protein